MENVTMDEDGKAFQNHMLIERLCMVVEFLNQKLGNQWCNGFDMTKPQNLLTVLKDGIALCKLLGIKARPESDENAAKLNIDHFRRECFRLGLSESTVFAVSDLLEPSSLSAICVVTCLQELRKKMLDADRALLNEHYSSPRSARKTMRNSPHGTPVVSRKISTPPNSGNARTPLGKGLLEILPGQQRQQLSHEFNSPRFQPNTPPTPGGSPVNTKSNTRRVSQNTWNTQASIAKVQEKMTTVYKERCNQLEAGNKELLESVEDLQDTIASLQRSKHEYQLQCEKTQDRNRTLLSNFRVMEAQIVACVEAWHHCKPQVQSTAVQVSELDRHMLALHETWNDIVEEKDVSTGLAGGISDGQITETEETDDEEEEAQEQDVKIKSSNESFKADLAATASLLVDDFQSNPKLSPAQKSLRKSLRKSLGQSMEKNAKAMQDELDATKQLLSIAQSEDKGKLELLENDLEVTKQLLSQSKDRCSSLEKELSQERELRTTIQSSLTEELASVKFEFADLSNDLRASLSDSASSFSTWAKELQSRVKTQAAAQNVLQEQFNKENKRRKQLLNIVHNLKGNIRVMCRIRPVLSSDLSKEGATVAVEAISDEKLTIAVSGKSATGADMSKITDFEFDRVFGPTSAQKHVFDEVQPLVESVMDGYHSCIFAYGQTGSGKTYTMSGDGSDNRGINFLALEELFRIHEARRSTGFKYTFTVKNVEIYCEKVIDLLAPATDSEVPNHLDIHFTEREGVTVPGCVEQVVGTAQEVDDVMALGAQNRSSAHTKMNMASSRSHSVVIVTVRGENPETGKSTSGKLVLVDLAGSERLSKSGVSGQELKEAQSINKSLSCLGDVIAALEAKAAHVPFRNSKLTTLLQDSLGKDNKALMILQVSPTTYNAQESTCSLNFAARVRQCELGKAKKKETVGLSSRSRAAIKQANEKASNLEVEIHRLEKQIEASNIKYQELEQASKAQADKIKSRLEEQHQNLARSSEQEIKTLRAKLSARDKADNGKMSALETELHSSKVEINNLKQQLRSALQQKRSIASPAAGTTRPGTGNLAKKRVDSPGNRSIAPTRIASPALVSKPPPLKSLSPSHRGGTPLADCSNEVINTDQEHKTPEQQQSRKQVSWKNTPQVIFPSAEKATSPSTSVKLSEQEEALDENQKKHRSLIDSQTEATTTPAVSSRPASRGIRGSSSASRSKTSAGATRVLQTPGKKPSVSRLAARRIPAAASKSRRGWNP